MKSSEIRQQFIDFFVKKGHKHIESSSLIPANDPTLLFANAGMNQFKDYFTGIEKPTYTRATTSQKCVRAGGKHNDLDNVGFTARHHTFFEMLGNFSFGDYFKKEAIAYHWELFTEVYKIPKDRLYITVHESDDEAMMIWHKNHGIPLDRIFKKGDKDNFWAMGDTGPCGPCTEIFFDWGPEYSTPGFDPAKAKDILEDDLRYVELANLVFMQFEATPQGRIPLPKPSVDTGAGLERLSAAIQGKYWNYDADLFSEIIRAIEDLSGKKYSDRKYQSSFRVVADHIRSCTMLITDGAIPSNEGRGYVLRRIIRRAVRHLRELGVKEVGFYKLAKTVFETLGKSYPENKKNLALAEKFLQLEEKKFLETLDVGMKFLDEAMASKVSNNILPGDVAFKLYDTFGFPIDLTEIICHERKVKIDHKGFEACMEAQRNLSKKSGKAQYGDELQKTFSPYKEKLGQTHFLGYKALEIHSQLLAIHDLGETKGLIFKETPFYGESGGQVGDNGDILDDEHVLAHIIDSQRPTEGLIVHFSKDADALEVGKSYILKVNRNKRALTARNHSATHLLQAALIKVLGNHVKQAGSSVNEDRLRFDFSHHQAVTKEELIQVENFVNQAIFKSIPVTPEVMSKEKAQQRGALAFFGEKYGNEVRVVQMGDFSVEFCGGTHVDNTQEIGLFTILSESSLASGVRRIEAQTSETAFKRLQGKGLVVDGLERILSSKEDLIEQKVIQILEENRDLSKQISSLNEKLQSIHMDEIIKSVQKINGVSYLVSQIQPDQDLKKLSDQFSSRFPQGICLLYSVGDDKINILLRSIKLEGKIDCGKILKSTLEIIGGRGGGRADMAQGSGVNRSQLQSFLTQTYNKLNEALS